MDGDIARIYEEHDVTGITPRQVKPLVRLSRLGPMTIRELSSTLGVTHSAASQTVSALRAAGLVRSSRGADARTRRIALTPKARALIPLLEAEWRATEATIAELESEIPYPLSRAVNEIEAAMARRSFHDRISEHLKKDGY
jgi:DNA-binding MarR family transcriptional regulator